MRRSTVGLLVALTLLIRAAPLAAANQPAPVPRIAFLGYNFPPAAAASTPFLDAFRHGLRARGWVEGDTLIIEWRWAQGSLPRFATLVSEVIGLQVQAIVVPNAQTAAIAKRLTTTIPIVVVAAGDLLDNGLIASLARPGGNVTGLTTMTTELTLTHLELLREALPKVTRVAVLQGLSAYSQSKIWPQMQTTAQAFGMELALFEVREPTAFDRAFAAMTAAQVDALLVLGDPFFTPYHRQIATLAARHRLPSIGAGRPLAEAGYLMSYGATQRDQGQHIAAYVDKILKGANPADLPVEQPMQFELVINLKTAQTLGLTLSPLFLFRADEVIR